MADIIAARFQLQDEAGRAVAALQDAGFPAARITAFYVNPPGQHSRHPGGGDRDTSPGAEKSEEGAVAGIGAGGAAGVVAGVAAAPLAGPAAPVAGALVGAYAGSLAGAMARTREAEDMPDVRQAGMLVAVALDGADDMQRAAATLRAVGGTQLERATGCIRDGDWADFDPLSTPAYLRG